MPTTTLCVERIDDYERREAEGFVGLIDPPGVPAGAPLELGSYELLLDEVSIGGLPDFRTLRIQVEPGDHVLASRSPGTDSLICVVTFTAMADDYYDTETSFRCLANGMLDSPLQSRSHSIKTRRRRGT